MSNTGVVVSFYGRKGYGFIKPDQAEENLFVHHSEIKTDGYRTLREGQEVKFSVVELKDGGKKAIKVTPVDNINVKKNRKKRNGKTNGGVDDRVCYNCDGVGHLSRNCTSVVKCVKCGVMAHNVRECPMKTGVVVSFYGPKGYSFIKPDEAGEDLFVHQSDIHTDGYRSLRKGQRVRFLVAEINGTAVKVTPVDKI
uniref:cold shock protein 1-like n=1 Tax=Erigeron canadensis TaxID=72917 RepID=UPI001CB88BFE|nr:cold shock protein 1-like [Erigeron canadensis]